MRFEEFTLCFGLLKKFISLDLFLRDFNARQQQQQRFLMEHDKTYFLDTVRLKSCYASEKRFKSEAGGKYQLLLYVDSVYRNAASSPHNQPWHYRAYGSSIQGHSSILMCDRAASLASLEKPPSRDFIDIAFWHPSFQTLFLLLLKEPLLVAI